MTLETRANQLSPLPSAALGRRPCVCVYRDGCPGATRRAAQVEAESQLPEVLMTYVHPIRKMAQWFALADADVALYAAKVTVWGIDTSFRYLGLAKTPMASGWLPDTVFQARFGFDPV